MDRLGGTYGFDETVRWADGRVERRSWTERLTAAEATERMGSMPDINDEPQAVAKALGSLIGGDDGASWDDDDLIPVPREWVRRAYRVAVSVSRDA